MPGQPDRLEIVRASDAPPPPPAYPAAPLPPPFHPRAWPSESDDDFMVIFDGTLPGDAHPSVAEVADALGGRPPGQEEIFGQPWLGVDELQEIANIDRALLALMRSVFQ